MIADLVALRPAVGPGRQLVACQICCMQLGNHRLGHLLRYSHGVTTLERMYAVGTRCGHCSVEFHSRPRLIKHLRRARLCLDSLVLCSTPLAAEELAAAEELNKGRRQAARAASRGLLVATLPATKL